ncbi:MAG: hypothetical protein JO322_00865 [Candidatus Eremiobacteraeota bacterium]|nr:hypothetical protein [Candidatus Eremiobacteraeota bacterium]
MFVRASLSLLGSVLVFFCTSVPALAQGHGLTVDVRSGILGWEGIWVIGSAPVYSEVFLDVTEVVSRDLPVISIGSYRVVADGTGAFSQAIPVAPAYLQNAVITVHAQLAGAAARSVTTTYRAPNADLYVPVWDDGSGH